MTDQTVLWMALSVALSLGLVWFQYYFRTRPIGSRFWLAALRFLSLLGLFLLLVNPKIEQSELYTEPRRLLLLFDNSTSLQDSLSRAGMKAVQMALAGSREIQERFEVEAYAFGAGVTRTDSLDFSATSTDIAGALQTLERAHSGGNAIVVMATDGHENTGRPYADNATLELPVYTIAVGDTTRYRDLRIDRINTNRYSFLGNQYPVEVLYTYTGGLAAEGEFRLFDNDRVIHRQLVPLEAGGNSGRIELLLRADGVGLHRLRAVFSALAGERNKANNTMQIGLEVVDERLRIGLVSRKTHPDIGALRRSIESNQQREFRQLTPAEAVAGDYDADLLILYEPDAGFNSLYEKLAGTRLPVFTIAGAGTDWNFLNRMQRVFDFSEPGPAEELLPEPNAAFDYFDASTWQVTTYPPLEGQLGSLQIFQDHQVLLGQRIKGVSIGEPLLALIRSDRREGLLLGQGLWKWRLQEFKETGNFENFDALWGKIWLFLSADGGSGRLTLDYRPVYEGLAAAQLRARFFDESFSFDPQARLMLQVRDSLGSERLAVPMSLRSGYYETDLSVLAAGTYQFSVTAEGTGISRSGQFSLLGFDLEAQQTGADAAKLERLAETTGGALFFPGNLNGLRDTLLQADRFRPVQRSRRNIVSLIDYRWLLGLIVLSLAAEWFIRKYKGSL